MRLGVGVGGGGGAGSGGGVGVGGGVVVGGLLVVLVLHDLLVPPPTIRGVGPLLRPSRRARLPVLALGSSPFLHRGHWTGRRAYLLADLSQRGRT